MLSSLVNEFHLFYCLPYLPEFVHIIVACSIVYTFVFIFLSQVNIYFALSIDGSLCSDIEKEIVGQCDCKDIMQIVSTNNLVRASS